MTQQAPSPEQLVLSLPDFSALAPKDEESPLPPKPPWWQRRGGIFTFILIALLILASFLAFYLVRGRHRPITYEKQQVTQGDFSLTVSATGPVQSSVYNLVFSGSGIIDQINVSVGQSVVKDQVLAKLNKTSLQDALNAAQASVLAAQTSVNNANANLSKTEAQSQASVQSAQVVLNNAEANLGTTQTQSQASINSAQTALSNAQTTLSHTQAVSTANITAAQTTLNNAQTALSNAEAALNACLASPPTTDPTCATPKATVTTAQAAFNSAQQALTTAQVQASANNANAQNGVNTAQQALASAESQASSSNSAAQNTVNTATAALASAQASANASVTSQQGSVNSAQSQLQTAMVGLQTAQHNLANATLLAPHAGIVTTINGTVGGTPGVSASSTSSTGGVGGGGTFIQISDTSTLQILASVNESDTANLKVGETALFTVSAYGNRIFTGIVSAISPFGQTVSNVVTFPVTVDVNKDDLQNANLLPGMTASTTIVVVQRPNVVLVPVNAINFARTATGTFNGIPPLITTQQAASALAQARQQRTDLINLNPSVVQDNPIPAYVIEQPGDQSSFIAVPVVLGLTDDTYYIVLQGLSPGVIIVVGAQRG